MKTNTSSQSQNGNALWFILVAIVLLGGLTMLLTRSGSNVTQSGDVEQMRIKLSQIMRWTKGIETAIEQMKLRGISESQISFKNGVTTVDYTNPKCGKPDCMVFGAGGGLTYMTPPAGFSDSGSNEWVFNAQYNVGSASFPIGTTTGNAKGTDLIVTLTNITPTFCNFINKELGIGTPGTIPTEDSDMAFQPFLGTYEYENPLEGDGAPPEFNGRNTGCFFNPPSGTYHFYYVLLAR